MRENSRSARHCLPALLAALLWSWTPAASQAPGVERTYPQSKAEVEKALADIRPSAKGRLPILEGFVAAPEQPLERFKNGYYECSIQVSPATGGGSMVRVIAKVTAWYSDSNPAKSGYRTLPSNGRLEGDLLDRLGEALEPGRTQPAPIPAPSGFSATSPQPAPSGLPRSPDIRPPDYPGSGRTGSLGPPAPATGARPEGAGAANSQSNDAAGSTLEREQAEKHANELRALAENLDEILRNQAHPGNLAAVRHSGTPVYAKPQTTAAVLFSAEAQDEFQILEVEPAWVHVQISGASRGWIRRAQVELPEGFAETPGKAAETGTTPGISFRVARESVSKFPGDWQPLRGKMVKVISVEPTAGLSSSPREKREFAKSLLAAEYHKIAASGQALAGIVVVFDSADGGQLAATLADLSQLQDGRISEAVFWQRCSLDPPEAFRDSGKPQ